MLAGRFSGRRDIARRRSASRLAGTSVRPIGCGLARAMRDMRSLLLFDPVGSSNGERPARREYTVAASAHTSLATVPEVSSSSTSGADHGIERPTDSSSRCVVIVDAMPKSESTG
jgi:hypothetical protein